jgi:cold shock CspA family protein/ribosome-associated translation inhibitor RaiA
MENAMDVPVEIVFHNMPSSPRIEDEIRDRVGKLDRLYEHLTGCRVSVEQLHRRHRTGNLFDVHIDLRVPGDEIVVSREPHRAREKFADPDLGIALRNAFRAAERRLLDYKRRQRGEVKLHEPFFGGQVSQLYPGEDHGFILTHEGSQLYFHRNSLMQRDFDRLKVGDRVHFVETVGDTGPIATKVWRAEGEPG